MNKDMIALAAEYSEVTFGRYTELPLVKAAIALIAEVQESHDTKPFPTCYGVPYGAVVALKEALAASPVPMSDTGAKEVPIAVLRRAFLASDGTLPDLIGHFCNEWNASIASPPPQSATSGLTAEFFAKHAQGSTTPQSAPGEALHPRTADLVDRFADSLKAKLAAAEKKYGYSDKWANDDWQQECAAKLLEHVAKGDPRDVAAYCAFMWHHDWSTTPTQASWQVSHGAKCPARDGYPCCCEVTQSAPQEAAEPDYSEMSREQLERHAARMAQALADDRARKFYDKHAFGPMMPPSCLCCGKLPGKVAISHAELPGVIICESCRNAALSAPQEAAEWGGGCDCGYGCPPGCGCRHRLDVEPGYPEGWHTCEEYSECKACERASQESWKPGMYLTNDQIPGKEPIQSKEASKVEPVAVQPRVQEASKPETLTALPGLPECPHCGKPLLNCKCWGEIERSADLLITYWRRRCVAAESRLSKEAGRVEAVAWEATTVAYKRFITQAQYEKFSDTVRRWYKPYQCSNCAIPTQQAPCEHCDDTGDVHGYDGEWRGYCECHAGVRLHRDALLKTITAHPLQRALSDAQRRVLDFLYGVGELEGCGFSEKPAGELGNFWWRKHLRSAFPDIFAAAGGSEK